MVVEINFSNDDTVVAAVGRDGGGVFLFDATRYTMTRWLRPCSSSGAIMLSPDRTVFFSPPTVVVRLKTLTKTKTKAELKSKHKPKPEPKAGPDP